MQNLQNKIVSGLNASIVVRENISLKDKNWFRTGGPAKFFAEPVNFEQFQDALEFAKLNGLEIFMLGEGANLLISDNGFDGLVIRPQLKEIKIISQDNKNIVIESQAGVKFQDLIDFCLSKNAIGLEEFSGIPGTVGGSVYINIHYFEFLLSQFLISAQVINKQTGVVSSVDNSWFNFGYNNSTLCGQNYYLVSAQFLLKKVDDIESSFAKGRSLEIIRHRQKRYPNFGTCGSFFRNFHENEVSLESNGKKMIYIAYYLDKIGVKGELKVGAAIVSYQHANMIVNTGNATTGQIIELVYKMQELVYKNFGIIPQPECRFFGFKEYPLLK